ncbi:MAG: hypothetical protein ACM31C_12540 [Acidobacteriota bacterium]
MDPMLVETTLERAKQMIAQLISFHPLQPSDDDYAKVFVGDAAARARAGYQGLWGAVPPWPGRASQTEIHVAGALAQDFAADLPRARFFPGGYKEIGHLLVPDVLWLMWEQVTPGERDGITFDGLVPIDDRWAWFPKPWRVVLPSP